jgi:hypothetical protein
MTGRTGDLQADNEAYPDFVMATSPGVLEEKRQRIAEWLLLIWLKHADPNILGLRRVDEQMSGRRLPMVHIAIPLEYRRKQLAQMLGISQLEDRQTTPRVNLLGSSRCDRAHSYIRVPARFIVSEVLDAIKDRLMQPCAQNAQAAHAAGGSVRALDPPRPKDEDENRRLRATVKHALAMKDLPIEPHQIQILTHRETREKWVRITNVDRGKRTMLRLAIKRAGISASLALGDDVEGTDWSIRFPATETSKLLRQSKDLFDVQPEPRGIAEDAGKDVNAASNARGQPTVRLFSVASTAESRSAPESRRGITMQRDGKPSDAGGRTRSVV